MSDTIIKVEGLGKSYFIGHEKQQGYVALRDVLTQKLKGVVRGLGQMFSDKSHIIGQDIEEFWALEDVSFSIKVGEAVGIIGDNGAGKSTLLKLLSRITEPTKGKITLKGRVASLLEVGTGFHPELSGRENIYLNGAILGMSRLEVKNKFNEIVEFSGVEKFLDTPVKRYSSGMYVRLAFAVAAHLEPEILVVDEVLAVGDSEFQKKCLGKMEDVSRSGRTVLFVSHNLAAIENLCLNSILLSKGKLIAYGKSSEVIQKYINLKDTELLGGTGELIFNKNALEKPIRKIQIFCDMKLSDILYMGCSLEIRVYFESKLVLDSPILGLIIKDSNQFPMLGVNNRHYGEKLDNKSITKGYLSMHIPYLTLFEGNYTVDVHFGNGFTDLEVRKNCFTFKVEGLKFSSLGSLPDKKINKMFIKDIKWSINED